MDQAGGIFYPPVAKLEFENDMISFILLFVIAVSVLKSLSIDITEFTWYKL